MKKFRIQRVNDTQGVIYQMMYDGTEEPISTPTDYMKCMLFVQEKQKELKIYKISRIGTRKDAKRHLHTRIYAEDNNGALEGFNNFLKHASDDVTFELLTGDWKMIAIRRPEQPIIIL